jgi:hypothetical protein
MNASVRRAFVGDANTAYQAVGSTHGQTQGHHWTASGPQILAQPSLNYTRKTWWNSTLSMYCAPSSQYPGPLTATQRDSATQGIASDLRFIFRVSTYLFAFFHVPSFLETCNDPVKRERMQPSLLLSLLAISTFWQSSELERGQEGREKAMLFRQAAQSAWEASCNANAIDETLAQAAWVIHIWLCPCDLLLQSADALPISSSWRFLKSVPILITRLFAPPRP